MSDITRSEALKELKEYVEGLDMEYATPFDKAILFAISSLETDEAYQLEYERTTKNDLGVDAISRQAVLNTLDNMDSALDEDRTVETYKELLKECYKILPSVTPQEPKFIAKSDGTIEQIKNCNGCVFRKEWEKIGKLLSVVLEKQTEQEPKTGHWIPIYQGDEIIDYRCSECEFGNTFGRGTFGMDFCPRCGADMREVVEE